MSGPLFLGACTTTASPTPKGSATFVGFENPGYSVGDPYDLSRQNMDWTVRGTPSRMNAQTTQITDKVAHNGQRSLMVTYAPNMQSVKQAAWDIDGAQQYTLSYALRFEDGFEFNGQSSAESGQNGGKLPGLAGRGVNGSLCSGGMNCANGGGFTARLMWRTDGDVVLYLYDHTKSMMGRKWGENIAFKNNTRFVPGRWHHIKQTVTLNTPGQADGRIDIWMDGQKTVTLTDRKIVTGGEDIDTVLFSTFFGGNSQPWFPATAQTAYFDDFMVR